MAVVKIEGKEITLPDDVVKAGDKAIRAVLAANGFPAIENADIQIVGAKGGAPSVVNVAPRSTGKGHGSSRIGPVHITIAVLLVLGAFSLGVDLTNRHFQSKAAIDTAVGDRFELTVQTESDTVYLVDQQGRQVGSFGLPKSEPIALTIRRKVAK